MRIESLEIDRFGGLAGISLALVPGVNIIEGSNESGKSTIAAFIRFMLYGFKNKAEREFYCGGAAVSGVLTYADGGTKARVERSCSYSGRDKVRLVDLAAGNVISEDCIPGEVILGVPAEVYDGTAYIGQTVGGKVDGAELGEAIENLLFSADESVNTAKSIKKLDDARVSLLHKNKKGGKIRELEDERDALKLKLDNAVSAQAEILAKEGSAEALREKLAANAARSEELELTLRKIEDGKLLLRRRELDTLRRQAEDAAAKRDELAADITHNGFIPDTAYVVRLKKLRAEIAELERRCADVNEKLAEEAAERFEQTSYNFSPSAALEERGGEDTVTRELRGHHKKRTGMGILGGLFGGLFIAGLFFGALLTMINMFGGLAVILLSLLLLLAAVLCVYSAVRAKRLEVEILDALGVANIGEYYEFLPVWREEAARQREARLKTGNDAEATRLKKAAEDKKSELSLLAARWGSFPPDEIIAQVEQSLAELSELDSEVKMHNARLEGALSGLEEIPEDELSKRLENAPSEQELEGLDNAVFKREYNFTRKTGEAMTERLHNLEKELAALNASAVSPANIADRISELDTTIRSLTFRHAAYLLAAEKLADAASALRESVSPRLSEYAGEYMSSLTSGKYPSVGVGGNLALSYRAEGGKDTLPADYMSAGTLDAAYVSLRLSLIRLLYRISKPALIFDESFARLDDSRLTNMLTLLLEAAEEGVQSAVLTSQNRDADIIERLGGKFTVISLDD